MTFKQLIPHNQLSGLPSATTFLFVLNQWGWKSSSEHSPIFHLEGSSLFEKPQVCQQPPTLKAKLMSSALCTIMLSEEGPHALTVHGIKKSPGRDAVGTLLDPLATSRPGSNRSIVSVTPSPSLK